MNTNPLFHEIHLYTLSTFEPPSHVPSSHAANGYYCVCSAIITEKNVCHPISSTHAAINIMSVSLTRYYDTCLPLNEYAGLTQQHSRSHIFGHSINMVLPKLTPLSTSDKHLRLMWSFWFSDIISKVYWIMTHDISFRDAPMQWFITVGFKAWTNN